MTALLRSSPSAGVTPRSNKFQVTSSKVAARPFPPDIWNDFTAFRARFEARNATIDRRHAVDGDRGWRWREGDVRTLTADEIAGQRRWWESNLYRTLHRIAARDPDLSFLRALSAETVQSGQV